MARSSRMEASSPRPTGGMTLIAFSRFGAGGEAVAGHAFTAFVITVAAAEAAVALALAVSVYRSRQTVEVDQLDLLKL